LYDLFLLWVACELFFLTPAYPEVTAGKRPVETWEKVLVPAGFTDYEKDIEHLPYALLTSKQNPSFVQHATQRTKRSTSL